MTNGPRQPTRDPGDIMAERIATGLASLVGVAVVAAGAALYNHSSAISQLQTGCESRGRQIDELRERVGANPSPDDLQRCGTRLAELERDQALNDHRIRELEERVRQMPRLYTDLHTIERSSHGQPK